ncbi:hypothetical protein ACQZV8_11770, partial [Magnetococcales bacterium HHB-1]
FSVLSLFSAIQPPKTGQKSTKEQVQVLLPMKHFLGQAKNKIFSALTRCVRFFCFPDLCNNIFQLLDHNSHGALQRAIPQSATIDQHLRD